MSYRIGAVMPATDWFVLRDIHRDDGTRLTFREPVAGFAVLASYSHADGDEGEPRVEALLPGDCGAELYPASLRDETDARDQRLWHTGDSACSCEPYYHTTRETRTTTTSRGA